MRILPLIVFLACLAWHVSARPQDDTESRAISNRGALLKRGLAGKQKTTTTTSAPQEEAEYEEEGDYPVEGEVQEPSTEATPSSTEGKKVGGLPVRPFRSNTDLLAALKRRRAEAAGAKSTGSSASAPQQSTDVQTEAPVKANFSKKRFNTATRETKIDEAPPVAPAKPSRGRFGRPSSRAVEEPEELNETTPSARSGRTFSRRGGN